MVDDAQYEFTSVQALRGTEATSIARWEKVGWELDRREQGLLRTELTFRRVKPKTMGPAVLAAFRGLEGKVQLLAVSAAVVVLAVLIGVVIDMQGGAGPSQPTASTSEADAGTGGELAQEPAATSLAAPMQSADAPLTVQDNADLAALVAITDPGAAAVGEFAAKYRGRTVEFDGYIAYLNLHGDYTTRYDILINSGDYNATASAGPNFQFRDVNITNDLHLSGSNVPDAIGRGNNLRIVARVGEYDSTQQLFFLEPVSTQVR